MSLVDNRFACLSGGAVITRYFAQLDDVLNSHYVYANTLVFQAGDTFEAQVVRGSLTKPLFGGVPESSRCYEFVNDDFEIATTNATALWVGALTGVAVGALYTYRFEVALTTIELFVGGVSKGTKTFTGSIAMDYLGTDQNKVNFYNGILSNPVATISGVTTSNTLGLATGNVEASVTTGTANSITYVNIPDSNREEFQLSGDKTQWDNISPLPQELPAVIEIA